MSTVRDYGAISATVPDVAFSNPTSSQQFSPTEFISLTEKVSDHISSIKSGWQNIEKGTKVIGTSKDNQQLRDKLSSIQDSANNKILSTTADLTRLTDIVRGGDKKQKLQVERLRSDFGTIVEKYSESQKTYVTKVKATLLSNASQMDDDRADADRMQQQQQQTTQQQLQIQRLEVDIQQERESRVRDLESKILNINAIMRDLAVMAQQQGDTVDTLETHIENVQADVEQGTEQLVKASASQTSYRKKVLILFVIALIVGIIVTSIVISKLNN